MIDVVLADEPARLSALQRYAVLDTQPEEPFDKITALVRTVLGVPMVAVSLVDADRQWFKSRQGIEACETARDISFCTHTIRGREPMIVPDAHADERFAASPLVTGPPHIRSYAGVPLRSPSGYQVGALCAMDRVPRTFEPRQMDVLARFAALVVDELELRQIAQRDQLTGALTRRGLLAEMEKVIAQRDRFDRPSALAMIDIDHFKRVNDTYGHPVGDTVLKAVAAVCAQEIRPYDIFGRLGGEEFAVLLPETTADEALAAAERIRQAIAAAPVDIGGVTLTVTASFGVAQLSPGIRTPEEWLAAADVPLYEAKRDGRNRCAVGTA